MGALTAEARGVPNPTIAYPRAVDGVLLRILEAGAGDDVLVLLHGVGARADRWHGNIGALASAGYRVFALDFPGHGFSEKRGDFPHGVPAYASLVARFAAEAGGGRPVALIGTSLGGHVAATVALQARELVRALVLVGPVGLRPVGEAARRRIAASILDTSVDGIRGKLRYVLARSDLATAAWVDEEHRINSSPGAAEALAAVARYFADELDDHVISPDELQALVERVPTLLVWGAEDAVVPVAIADELDLPVPLTLIAAAGHLPYLEQPDAFNEAVLAFLGELRR